MKNIAQITNENQEVITISFDGKNLFAGTDEIGPEFASEEQAAEYIFASYGSGWNLFWMEAAIAQ